MKQKLLKFLYRFLAICARIYISRHHIKVVAITGSVGKTSCRMVVAEVLQQVQNAASISSKGEGVQGGGKIRIYTSPKNYNSELGLVFSVFQIEYYHPSIKSLFLLCIKIFFTALFGLKNMDILVAEYGIDSPKDMEYLLNIAIPDIAVLTKLDMVHSANFPGGIEEYWQEKWKLLIAAKKKVYVNFGDSFSQQHLPLLKNYGEIFGKNLTKKQLLKDDRDIARWHFHFKEKTISHNLLGEENNHYVTLGLEIARDIGLRLREEKYDFSFKQQEGRFSFFSYREHILIDSSYNAAPESMKQVLSNTKLLQKELFKQYKLVAVLGDMRELEKPQEAHEQIASEILQFKAVFTVGPNMYEYLIPKLQELNFSGNIISSLSSRDIGQKLKTFLDISDTQYLVVFKGSQNTIFTEEALAALLTYEDQKRLPRQSVDWKKKKEEFFRGV